MQVDGWTKILKNLPAISNTEIDLFFEESASKIINSASFIKKNHLRGESFIIEKFIDTESVFSKQNEKYFYLKGYCSASKKQRENCLSLAIDKISKNIAYAICECPAGSGGLCSHSFAVMKLAASCSVQSIKYIPDEISCTAKPCLWSQRKFTNIDLKQSLPTICSASSSKRKSDKTQKSNINAKLYDARVNTQIDKCKIFKFKQDMAGTAISNIFQTEDISFAQSKFGKVPIGSPLSYQYLH